jgi:hypothetical protein
MRVQVSGKVRSQHVVEERHGVLTRDGAANVEELQSRFAFEVSQALLDVEKSGSSSVVIPLTDQGKHGVQVTLGSRSDELVDNLVRMIGHD